jgi:hypothetical protein
MAIFSNILLGVLLANRIGERSPRLKKNSELSAQNAPSLATWSQWLRLTRGECLRWYPIKSEWDAYSMRHAQMGIPSESVTANDWDFIFRAHQILTINHQSYGLFVNSRDV